MGYFFGRQLHQTLDVPIGLIDNAWGGSAAEAWIERGDLEKAGQYAELLKKWDDDGSRATITKPQWRSGVSDSPSGRRIKRATDLGHHVIQRRSNHRPANLFNGVLHPVLGYTIRGAIWYQGESNAGRAYQYRELFPLMIQTWRDRWGQDEFPVLLGSACRLYERGRQACRE